MPFTEYQLSRMKPPPTGRRIVTERGVPPDLRGLQLWVFASGTKTFVLRYKVAGRTRHLTLGSHPSLSLAGAHQKVQAHRAQLREGIDPVERQEAQVARNRAAPTVQHLYEDFRDHYLRRKRKRPGNAEGVLEVHIVGREAREGFAAVEGWGSRKAASITRREIIERIRAIEEAGTPRVAEVAKGLVGQMFGYAVDTGLLETSPAVRLPVIGSRGERRERMLTDEEILTFWTGLDRAKMLPQTRLALRLLLVTGQRRQELALAAWAEVDRAAKVWTIPASHSKNGREHVVPLSRLALSLLDELAACGRREREDGSVLVSRYVVPSPLLEDQAIDPLALTRAVRNNEELFGIPAFTPHDLRRTAASGMSALGVQRLHVAKVLNHTDSSVTATYDRHDYLPEKRAALDSWGRHLEAVLAGKGARRIKRPSARRAR